MGIKNGLQEERFMATFWDGLTVSGKLDYYDCMKILWDYKITSRYVLIDGVKPEWESQSNINAHLLRLNHFAVEGAKICVFFRDWSKIQAMIVPDYPKHQVAVLPVELWDEKDAEDYINERIKMHYQAGHAPSDQLPECTPKERWEKPTIYAVMKKGRKSSVRNLESMEAAERLIHDRQLDHNHSIQVRPGESTRCEYYCDVKDFCHQYKQMKEDV